LIESNITPWRRAVTGDLTSAFNFKSPNDRGLIHDLKVLPSTAAYVPPDNDRHPDYVPPVPGMQATFLQRVAGHVETGEDSASDPRFGK
jgi:phospholipase C